MKISESRKENLKQNINLSSADSFELKNCRPMAKI